MSQTDVAAIADRESTALDYGILAVVGMLNLDQVTKAWALSALWPPLVPHPVASFLNWRLGFNTGITFGMLSGDSEVPVWLLVSVAMTLAAWFLAWMWRSRSRLEATALGLVIGGTVGNVVDRLRQGSVTDFIDVHYAGWHWPTFNIADVGVVCGMVLLVMSLNPKPRSVVSVEADA